MSESSSHKPVPNAPLGSGSTSHPKSEDGGSGSKRVAAEGEMTIISARPPLTSLSLGRGSPFESANMLEGERLGQFVLQKFIGGGGMGIVFRALDTTLNREVALKVLSRDQSADEEALRRFRNEAQSAARLDHDNIARVHYVGEDRGVHYIVFEFIEGVNIRDLVERKGPLALDEAVSYTYQIAQALEHASQRSVIHRDIKPSNVLITPDGKAKLVDMGLARLNQVAQTDHDLTASGVTLGTFDYISPEQARDPRSADVRSDLYSLGCSFFYMLTGRPPFPEGTVLQKLLQHQGDHPPDPRTFRPELPPDVTRILARLLAKNPAQRFQSPGELLVELSELGERLGMQLSSPRTAWTPPRDATPSRLQHHLPWLVPLAALCLIVIAMDQFGTSEAPSESSPPLAARQLPPNPPRGGAPSGKAAPNSRESNSKEARADSPAANSERPSVSGKTKNGGSETAAEGQHSNSAATAPAGAASKPSHATAGGADANELSIESTSGRAVAAPELNSRLDPPPVNSTDTGNARPEAGDGARAPAASAAPSTGRDGLLIVSDHDDGPHAHATLRAALAEAKPGDTIELRFNGRRLEKPFTISNTRVTIRAGDGFRPVVFFRPEPNPVEYPPSMVTIAGGNLTSIGVGWELELPRDVPAERALIEPRRANMVRFEQCSLTIRNASLDRRAYHAGVAFFDVKAAPGNATMAMDPAAGDDQAVRIELVDVVARGEASLVRTSDLQPLVLDWDNGLLATSEHLLAASGGALKPPEPARDVEIGLRHVTAAIQGGLLSLTNSVDSPYQLMTRIHATDCILISNGRPPLVEQSGSDDVDEYLSRLEWNGDHNCFDGFDVFWQVERTTPPVASKSMAFDEWRDYWGSRVRRASDAAIAWRGLPSSNRPFYQHVPSDYVLDPSVPNNPPVRAAADGLDSGFIARRLSGLAADETNEAAPAPRDRSTESNAGGQP